MPVSSYIVLLNKDPQFLQFERNSVLDLFIWPPLLITHVTNSLLADVIN
jgi:hypothetical protein